MRVSVIVPTLNPGHLWANFSDALLKNLDDLGLEPGNVLILDSASTDGTVAQATAAGFRVLPVAREDFDHGGTRQTGALCEKRSDFLVFLTQDAVLASPKAIRTLLAAFTDPSVAAAYGRQLPRPAARGIEVHARLFNYPAVSRVRSLETRQTLGFKSIFSSNSFCAFRRVALMEAGGFPRHAICSEETIAIAQMHLRGWLSAYVAEAQVYHSHPFTIVQEFQRYFDVGVTHARQPFLVEQFGTSTGEGHRFVLSEMRYLLRNYPQQLPTAVFRTLTKFAGYMLGRREGKFSLATCRRLSMNRSFWNAEIRWSKLPGYTSLQSTPGMIQKKFDAEPNLRPSAELAAEVSRMPTIQQQWLRKPNQPTSSAVVDRPNPHVM